MTDDDPYGRDTAWSAVHADRAAAAAERIAAREAASAANVDPATVAALLELIKGKPTIGAYREHVEGEHPLTPYLIDWAVFWTADHDDTEWLLEPIFADGRSHALYAAAKTGKSYLILAAAAALATGRAFMAQPAGDPVHVLYVDYEMTAQDIHERLELFGYGPDDDLSHLHYALLPSLPPLDTAEGGQALLAAATAVSARFVVIDTMSRAIMGDENDADTFRAFYRHTGLALKQANMGWMRLDHAGKDATKGMRGSSGKADDVDVVLRLERTDGGQRLHATHRRMAWYPEASDIAVTEVDGVVGFMPPHGELWPEGTAELAKELDRIGVPLSAGRPAARRAMREHDVAGENKVLAKALKWRRLEAERLTVSQVEALADDFLDRHGVADNGSVNAVQLSADSSIHSPVDNFTGMSADSTDSPYKQRADSSADSADSSSGATADRCVSEGTDTPVPALPSDDVVTAVTTSDDDEDMFG